MLFDAVKRDACDKSTVISRPPQNTMTSNGQLVFINKSGPNRSLRGQEVGAVASHVARHSHARRKRVARTEPGKIRPCCTVRNAACTREHDRALEETQAHRPLGIRTGKGGSAHIYPQHSSDSDRNEINGWAQLFFLLVAWPRVASYITDPLSDSVWDNLSAQYCYGPPQTCAMLACGEYMKAVSTAEGSYTVPKILEIRKAEAVAAVKKCIEQNNITKSLAFATLHLAALEVQMGNIVAAMVHQRAAGKVMASIRMDTWTTAEILYVHDNWIATPCMPMARQIPVCINPGPWSDGQLLDSSEYIDFLRTRTLSGRTVELFVDIRELFRVREFALTGESAPQTKIQAWIHLRASSIKQTLASLHSEMEELLLGIGGNEQTKGQRILTSTITSALSLLMASTFCGAFANLKTFTMPPLLTTLITTDTVLDAADFTVATDLALWLHFVAWLVHDAAHPDLNVDARDESRSRIRICTRFLGLSDERGVLKMLQNFVYSPRMMKNTLQTFIADGCGLTSNEI